MSYLLFVIPWTAARQASLSFTISWSLLKFTSIESVMLSNHLILCRPLLLLPSVFSSVGVFSNELALCIRWPNYWSFQLQHQSFQWLFRVDFLKDWLVGSPCSPRESSLFFFLIYVCAKLKHRLSVFHTLNDHNHRNKSLYFQRMP